MARGDSDDILNRVKMLIPFRWFAWIAPLRDAVLGGLSDSMAWCYQWIVYAKQQSRIATSTGPFLDLIAYDFLGRHLYRGQMTDDQYRARILATILQERVTRKGMTNALMGVTSVPPIIFEPWNTGDAGAWCGPVFTPACGGTFAWSDASGVGGAGAWGSIDLPAQFFIKVTRSAFSGVPLVAGWSGPTAPTYCGAGAWAGPGAIPSGGVGAIELFGVNLQEVGITDQMIYDTINTTRPTGSIAWTQFQ